MFVDKESYEKQVEFIEEYSFANIEVTITKPTLGNSLKLGGLGLELNEPSIVTIKAY